MLQALAESETYLNAEEAALKAGYEPGAHVRRVLSQLRKAGLVTHRSTEGYAITKIGRDMLAALDPFAEANRKPR